MPRLTWRALNITVTVCLAAILAGCGSTSQLRSELDQLKDAHRAELIDGTRIAQKYIPMGTGEREAEAILQAAGFSLQRTFVEKAPEDARPLGSERYGSYSLTATSLVVIWTNYDAVVGISGGNVDFIDIHVRTSSI